MEKLNPIERAQYIDSKYKEYLRSTFYFQNKELQKLFDEKLSEEELYKGPYVSLSLPFQRGKSINELIEEGVVCDFFRKLKGIDFDRPLYAHQEQAVRRAKSGRSIIITTGTGSGKTEGFLYPILNEIVADNKKGNNELGIRAIFLYPLNALINDQIDKVRQILTGYQDITFGFFTGDTDEKVADNYREKQKEEKGVFIPENELVSREEIRKKPPHLLFTNYSMLEYMLIRPNDYSLFTPEKLSNWKYVVLDEAHTYAGAKGIEMSMLMRRLTGLADKKPRFILTSATLGEQGESEKNIIEFAKNLTSAEFDVEDIIFSKRIVPNERSNYVVSGKDYISLKEHKDDIAYVKSICEKYNVQGGSDVNSSMFNLLHGDKHVFNLYSFLKSGAKDFNDICLVIDDLMKEELTALIELINFSEKDGFRLFDLKYHSFVRSLAGAFTTLCYPQELTFTKTNRLKGLKAFEIGNCVLCNAPYIIGRVRQNQETKRCYLFQNDEVDIYENYGDNDSVKVDYFVLNDDINEDEVDRDSIEESIVCAKCGCIYSSENLNAVKCDCGDLYKRSIYRVMNVDKTNEPKIYNNIRQCPCCGRVHNSGIVKNLSIGKDEGTAVILQQFYDAIDEGESYDKTTKKLSLKSHKEEQKSETKTNRSKQILMFSDSRQQASFAKVFFDSRNVRFMQKRLIWDVIEKKNYETLEVNKLVSYLADTIKRKDIFSNGLNAEKNAWLALMSDLLKLDGNNDGEGVGLYYFALDLSEIMNQIDEGSVQEVFGKYNITKADLATLMQVTLSVFKIAPAIDYIESTLSQDEKRDYLGFRRFDNYVIYSGSKKKKNIRSFLPIQSSGNMTLRYAQKVCRCSRHEAEEILYVIFNELAINGGLLKKSESQDAYQIKASKYIVKNYKNSKYYRCSKCGRLTPYNIHNVCVQDKCEGNLYEIDPDIELKNNYYRNLYKNKKIEKIVAEEHTAQLSREAAKEYQQEFKENRINILSSSTTFEMGIDIGDLENVFMRNVPPTPANYVQRAGRAGRRKDSSAFILTYCSSGSHDYTYFSMPGKMISGVINPPFFNVLNKKIIIRHLMASCLGFFFRKYPVYFESDEKFVFKGGVDELKKYIKSCPEDLNHYINDKVIPESIYEEFHNFKWYCEEDKNDKLNQFVENIRQIEGEYKDAKEEALRKERYRDAEYYKNQIENIHKEKVINSLSTYCVIPKYGFPVDVVDLKIYKDGRIYGKYDLNRDLKMAISEYAPDSEIVVDGNKYTSKYIITPRGSEFSRHYFCTCIKCKKTNVYRSIEKSKKCKYCGADINLVNSEFYIEPVYGFKTGKTKESTMQKPKRSRAGEVSYLGGGVVDEQYLEFGEVMKVQTSSNDELLVLNTSSFYMCPHCGYSEIIKGKTSKPIKIKEHQNSREYICEEKELQLIRLGCSFQTDVAKITIPMLKIEDWTSYSKALSFLYAFLEGISNALEIERNDINGIVEPNIDTGSYDIYLYDNVSGGAGHVKRLMDKDAVVRSLKAGLIKVSQDCCDLDTSCYNCLRNYYNQTYHSILKRVYAKDVLEELLAEIQSIV